MWNINLEIQLTSLNKIDSQIDSILNNFESKNFFFHDANGITISQDAVKKKVLMRDIGFDICRIFNFSFALYRNLEDKRRISPGFINLITFSPSLRFRSYNSEDSESDVRKAWFEFIEIADIMIRGFGDSIDIAFADDDNKVDDHFVLNNDRPVPLNAMGAFTNQLWLMFYGWDRINLLGKDTVLNAPSYQAKEYKNGILLLNNQAPSISGLISRPSSESFEPHTSGEIASQVSAYFEEKIVSTPGWEEKWSLPKKTGKDW
ncbi:MAG: hypothetical protein AABW68_00520 [archaeon]